MMAKRSDTCRFKTKIASRWRKVTVLMSELSCHSFSNEANGCSYEWIINHWLSESFKAVDSFTNETPLLIGISLENYYFIVKYNKQLWQYCLKNVGYI